MSRAREAEDKCGVGSWRRTTAPRGPSRTRITRMAKQSAKMGTIERIDFSGQWNAELRAHQHGQRLDLPSTWRFDNLYHAANWQTVAEYTEELLARALDNKMSERIVAALVIDTEYAWRMARDAFLADGNRQGTRHA